MSSERQSGPAIGLRNRVARWRLWLLAGSPGADHWSVLLVANATAALGFATLGTSVTDPRVLALWTGLAFAVSFVSWFAAHRDFGRILNDEVRAGCLGLVWAAVPALFFDASGPGQQIISIGLLFAIAGIGALVLSSRPTAALVFCCMILAALAWSSVKLGGRPGWALALCTLSYGVATATVIFRMHRATLGKDTAERELTKRNEIISLLLKGASESQAGWLWETSPAGTLTYVSEGLLGALKLPPQQVIGQHLDLFAPMQGDPPGWHELQSAMLRRKAIDGLDVRLAFPQQGTWWRFMARPVMIEDGTFLGYQGAAYDVTAERNEHDRLAAAKAEAEQLSANKSQFLAVMSHELRTPLNAVVGFAELLNMPAKDGEEDKRREHLQIILDSSRHLLRLINDMLDFTRIEKGGMTLVEQETDAAELVEVAVKMCRSAAERSDNTVIANIADGIALRCDIMRLTQILTNLVTNALKFSPAGGFVHVGFERGLDGSLSIYVRDAGLGIAGADLERIFEPYVQADEGTSRRYGGVGLGLAIARRIALLHGGNVTIESELGVGTTARLVLPASRLTWPEALAEGAVRAA